MQPIPGYYDVYLIDEYGNIFSVRRQGCRGQVLSPGLDASTGYLKVNLRDPVTHTSKTWSVHRLVAITFLPNPNNLPCVNHLDGNKLNNHISNLEWCTPKDNVLHALDTGLIKTDNMGLCGEKHHQCKISDHDVLEIRELRTHGVLSHELAEQYHVSGTTIRNILYGRRKLASGEVLPPLIYYGHNL